MAFVLSFFFYAPVGNRFHWVNWYLHQPPWHIPNLANNSHISCTSATLYHHYNIMCHLYYPNFLFTSWHQILPQNTSSIGEWISVSTTLVSLKSSHPKSYCQLNLVEFATDSCVGCTSANVYHNQKIMCHSVYPSFFYLLVGIRFHHKTPWHH
jgi:hypothetical protein